jgi:hypothetical protein
MSSNESVHQQSVRLLGVMRHRAGTYNTTEDDTILSDVDRFEKALNNVIKQDAYTDTRDKAITKAQAILTALSLQEAFTNGTKDAGHRVAVREFGDNILPS